MLGLASCTGGYQGPAGPFLTSEGSREPPTAVSGATPTIEPSPERTDIPTPASPRPPGTTPVYGTIRVRIVPIEAGTRTDAGLSIVTMRWVAPAVPGSGLSQVAQDVATGDFRMVLSPFELYVLDEVELTGGLFGFEPTGLPTNGPGDTDPAFVVPGSGCVYVGRLTFTYLLLPRADSLTQLSMASDLARGGSLSILFTSAGTFVYLPDAPTAHLIDLAPVAERPAAARGCPVRRVQFRDLAP